jgi:DNA-directed RNA polymerase subunit H (RpoH/RPB5)
MCPANPTPTAAPMEQHPPKEWPPHKWFALGEEFSVFAESMDHPDVPDCVEYLSKAEHTSILEAQSAKHREEMRIAKDALRKIATNDPAVYDGILAWSFKEIAREAFRALAGDAGT